jgi:DNA repair protein RAD50
LSKKCADADTAVPALMGVSTALLENVIFCHQEESFWPLSDDKTLKTKFDQIFSASQYDLICVVLHFSEVLFKKSYSKALEHLKSYKKELSDKLKDYKHSVELLTKDLQNIELNQKELKKVQSKMDSIKMEIARIEKEVSPWRSELEDLQTQHEEIAPLQRVTADLKARLDQKIFQRDQVYSRIEQEFEGDFPPPTFISNCWFIRFFGGSGDLSTKSGFDHWSQKVRT